MTSPARRKLQKELNAGAIALVLLTVLERTGEAMYGYQIAKRLAESGPLPMHQGALYPALRSLEKRGLVSSRLQPSRTGPPRRYYRVTAAGKAAAREWREAWLMTRTFVDSVLEADHDQVRRTGASADPTLPGVLGAGAEKASGRDA